MIYTPLIHRAIRFSIKTHEVYQKQKRKGKDIPYITHPLAVGLILARAGADETLIAAGILHDTIEDSTSEKKVTTDMLTERFGEAVATLVASVTEFNKDQSWEIRKREAIEHINTFSHDSLLLKSADIISNTSELLDDYAELGNAVFDRFNAPQEKILKNYLETITAIITRWPDSPLAGDLQNIFVALEKIIKKQGKDLFVGFIINEKNDSYEVYLVNPTQKHYNRVFALTGAFCGDDGGVLETSKVTREKGILPPYSALLLERSDLGGLDFVIWYHLDLYEEGTSSPAIVWFSLPKYSWNYTIDYLSVLEKDGVFIKLENRNDKETIEEEVKHLNMDGGYHESSGA